MNVLLEWEPVTERQAGTDKPAVVYERAWVPGGWLVRELDGKPPRAVLYVPDPGPSWGAELAKPGDGADAAPAGPPGGDAKR